MHLRRRARVTVNVPFDAAARPLYPEGSLLMAPLSTYTDVPFRLACRRFGCRFAFTPLVDAGSLVHRAGSCGALLARGDGEAWLGVQLLGASPEILGEAAAILSDLDFDALDLNMGCPVPKVTRRGAGAALGGNTARSARCIEALTARSRFPVTAKIRVLDPVDPGPTVRYAAALEGAGIAALTVHGRVQRQVYSGPVADGVIRAVGEALKIPVIANGGVWDRESAQRLSAAAGCSRIMIARGAIGNPWIFSEIRQEGPHPGPSHEEVCEVMREHVLGMAALHGQERGMRIARKVIHSYLVGRGYRRFRREAVSGIASIEDFEEFHAAVAAEGPSPTFRPQGQHKRIALFRGNERDE